MSIQLTDGVEWRANGVYHRDGDEPARVFDNGRREWWVNGKLHRDPGAEGESKPALITETGNKLYYKNGISHRDGDKPAVEYANGYREWWVEGQLHRDPGPDGEDRPACITQDGDLYYYKNGVIHRDGDKPAVISSVGQNWRKNGEYHRDTVDESGDPLPAFIGPEWSTWFVDGVPKNSKYPWVSRLKDGTKGYYHESDSCILFDNGLKFNLDKKGFVISQSKVFMDERTDIEPYKCCVCMENKRNTMFNCGHLCSCRACSEKIANCPVCRADVKTRTNVYL